MEKVKKYVFILLIIFLIGCENLIEEEKITITFDYNNIIETQTKTILINTKLERPEEPTKEGYTFDNWYKEETYGTKFNFDEILTKDTTIYGKFDLIKEEEKITITFDYNNIIETQSKTILINTKLERPEEPTKEGYTFDNWYKEETYGTKFNFDEILTKDTTIYGKFDIIEIIDDETKYYKSYGFADLTIKNRNNNNNIYEVNDEIEFIEALLIKKDNKIIKINNDLNMGYIEVKNKFESVNKDISKYTSVYKENSNKPLLHPTLKETGIGQMILNGVNGLMIYSEKGIEIKHLTTSIKGNSSDIVFRNLKFSEIWEWDESSEGGYKKNDWDYFTIEKTDGIWFDHLTFKNSYDGIIDMKKEVKNVTMSYLDLDFTNYEFINTQIEYLENNKESNPYYESLREKASIDEIKIMAASQKKGFNLGNTTDGDGFESITVTMHHIYAKNLQDRFPRLRKGDVHLYNVILNNTDLYNLKNINIVNQGLIPTEEGTILMENSIFYNVTTPIKNHQDSDDDIKYTGKFKVLNSKYVLGTKIFEGSSKDSNTVWKGNKDNPTFEFRNYKEIPYQYIMEDLNSFESNLKIGLIQNNINWLKING